MGLSSKRLGVVLIACALLVGTFLTWLRARPLVREDELESFESLASTALVEVHTQQCMRPALGVPQPGDGTSRFVALLDTDGAFRACHAHLEREHEALVDALGPWRAGSLAPLADVEREALAACAGLADEVRAIAASESVCSPRPLGDARGFIAHLRVMQTVLLDARSLESQGDHRASVALLLAALQVSLDFQRGRVATVTGWIGDSVMQRVIAQLHRVLSSAALDEATLADASERITSLIHHAPQPDGWFRDDALQLGLEQLAARGWQGPHPFHLDAVPVDDEALFDAISMREAFQGVRCAANETRESCFRRFVEGQMTAMNTQPVWPAWAGPRAARERSHDAELEETFEAFTRYWHGVMMTEAHVRALLGVVAARLHRLRTGRCPSAEALASDGMNEGFGGTFSLVEREDALEIEAPAWLDELAPEPLDQESLTLAQVPCAAVR